MKISEALSPARDIEVRFETGLLNVTYRPAAYTVEQIERLDLEDGNDTSGQRKARLDRLIDTIGQTVVSWDLTYDDETMIDPTDREALRRMVPTSIFIEILKAIKEDQKAGEAERPSDDS